MKIVIQTNSGETVFETNLPIGLGCVFVPHQNLHVEEEGRILKDAVIQLNMENDDATPDISGIEAGHA